MARDNKQNGRPNIVMEDVRLIFKNFSGNPGRFNAKGDRNFGVILPDDIAKQLEQDGWNVKFLKPREEGDEPTPWLKVKVNFSSNKPPRLVMITSRGRTNLGPDEASILDWADIKKVDLIVSPYNYTLDSGTEGITAYLQSIYVTINEDELELKYADVPTTGQSGFVENGDTTFLDDPEG